MERPGRFLRLPAAERRLLAKAALLLAGTGLGLRLLPFETVRRLLSRATGVPVGTRDALPTDRIVWAVEAAGRRMPPFGTCLTQALAAQVLLERRGHPARIHIGAMRGEEGQLEAHAWVESEGKVVIGGQEKELERYTPLVALEGKKH